MVIGGINSSIILISYGRFLFCYLILFYFILLRGYILYCNKSCNCDAKNCLGEVVVPDKWYHLLFSLKDLKIQERRTNKSSVFALQNEKLERERRLREEAEKKKHTAKTGAWKA